MKKFILVVGFLIVWIGSIILYANSTDSFSETTALFISGFWIVLYILFMRRLGRRSKVSAEEGGGVLMGQMMAQDHHYDGDDASSGDDFGDFGGE